MDAGGVVDGFGAASIPQPPTLERLKNPPTEFDGCPATKVRGVTNPEEPDVPVVPVDSDCPAVTLFHIEPVLPVLAVFPKVFVVPRVSLFHAELIVPVFPVVPVVPEFPVFHGDPVDPPPHDVPVLTEDQFDPYCPVVPDVPIVPVFPKGESALLVPSVGTGVNPLELPIELDTAISTPEVSDFLSPVNGFEKEPLEEDPGPVDLLAAEEPNPNVEDERKEFVFIKSEPEYELKRKPGGFLVGEGSFPLRKSLYFTSLWLDIVKI